MSTALFLLLAILGGAVVLVLCALATFVSFAAGVATSNVGTEEVDDARE